MPHTLAALLSQLDPAMPYVLALWLALGLLWHGYALRRNRQQTAWRDGLGLTAPAVPLRGQTPGLGLVGAFTLLLWLTWALHGGPGQALVLALDAHGEQQAAAFVNQLPLLKPALLGITHTGDVLFLGVLTAAVALWLLRQRRWLELQIWCYFAVLNGLAVRVLKLGFLRERPHNLHELVTSGASFPSGHSAGATLVYGLLVMLVGAAWPPRRRAILTGLALLWISAIALSRVLLAAHWCSDVIAGLALGLLGLCGAACVLRQRLGQSTLTGS